MKKLRNVISGKLTILLMLCSMLGILSSCTSDDDNSGGDSLHYSDEYLLWLWQHTRRLLVTAVTRSRVPKRGLRPCWRRCALQRLNHLGRNAAHHHIVGHVLRYYSACSNYGILAYGYTGTDNGTYAYPCILLYRYFTEMK